MITKFRAWDKEKKLMNIVDGIHFDEDKVWEISCHGVCWRNIRYYILMQSTGLHDVNGKEIFEGDVVKYIMGMKFTIVFHKNAFGWFEGDDFIPFADMAQCQLPILEVVGNIHEHLELLK